MNSYISRKILIATICLVFVGCATTGKYEETLTSWLGSNINSLVASWGYASQSFEAPNGNKVYVYTNSNSYTTDTTTTKAYDIFTGNPIYKSSGGQTMIYSCQTFFEVNKKNIIIKWRYEGNSCRSR
tara:strand:- start:620 stop:1000 length:381 start_codon:yes stop_codon:yes gene_type:complete